MNELRPYQVTAIDSALAALSNSGSAVLQMPTGAGKTRAATEIVKGAEGPVWFVCHRQEIERQAAKAFTAAGIDFGIVSPRGVPEYDKPVQIVSVGTLARRIADLPAPKLVAWDECHHIPAKSWAAIRVQLADAKHLGLTATPERLDGKGLSEWFAELVTGPTTRELIDAGYLSDFRYFAPSDPDLSAAKMQAGDYRKADLAKVMNTPVLIGDAVAEYLKSAAGKRALVFCASVEASRALVERFNAEGVPALHVDGTTPAIERDDAVEALASGSVKVLSNVEVFTEGFDLPAIDVVILLRPTKSLALFLQMVGRALRRAEGKTEALIFDHAGLWLDHGWLDLPVAWSLDGGARKRRLAGMVRGPRRCPECKEVRVERAPVCDCGYEFPTGREIGEYDGELSEMRGVVPEGCETVAAFARRIGCSRSSCEKWIERGIPTKRGFISIDAALGWLGENPPSKLPPIGMDSNKYMKIKHFAKSIGVSEMAVNRMRSSGMPCAANGWVETEMALMWLKERNSVKNPPIGEEKEYIRKSEFCSKYEFSQGAVDRWIIKGMPTSSNGWINIGDAFNWLSSDKPKNIRPLDVIDSYNYESREAFKRRAGIRSNTRVRGMAKRGLPCASNGWVHIQRGLEWVRDNTSIQIPPEAWPSANDNATLSAAA